MKRISEVADGVLRVDLSLPKGEVTTNVHCFLINSRGGYIMVDSGWRKTGPTLVEAINSELGKGTKINRLVLTHLHPDHYGGAGQIRENFAPQIAYHRGEMVFKDIPGYLAWIRGLSVPREVFEYLQSRAPSRLLEMPAADEYLVDGDELVGRSGTWTVLHTPGHTAGHICLFQKESRVLLSGDHLLPNESSNVGAYPIRNYNPLKLYLANLAKVATLDPSLVVPSHGEPFGDAKGRVAELFDHHKERLREVFEGLDGVVLTPAEAARTIKWSRGAFEELQGFDRWLAIAETISHLEFLRGCKVASKRSRPKVSYQLSRKDWATVENAVDKLKP
jgi:glyoxylase-like metal-dependent hydrolase (beta-lactamase superfamily II)